MRYIRPKSVTWWAGVFSIAIGIAMMAGAGRWTNEFGVLIAMLSGNGDSSPAAMMGLGFGLIGIRDKLSRVFSDADDH
jgi:drug/metabolite transporter (DMT)-like permease